MSGKKAVLFGAGNMGLEYSKILEHVGVDYSVVGRSVTGVERFNGLTGLRAVSGGFPGWERQRDSNVEYAIVAVSVEELSPMTMNLMDCGVRKILLEKPAGLNAGEIKQIRDKAEETGTKIIVGYNRRFYASVLKAQEIIRKEGGVQSFNFEFTEWVHLIPEGIHNAVKRNWFLANSTHVIDMAFFLGGRPKEIKSFVSGGCDWHPAATVFSGAGISENGALFSYQANWFAPGRWGVEILTKDSRLIFRPLEKLQIQRNRSVAIDFVEIDDRLDRDFKPGLFRQTEFFLNDVEHPNFITIDEHYDNVVNYYQKIIEPV
ncbi:MAG: Gfo/Idh/MocA family oxidoreductase [Deltaproteobacteria bacterium]|nr:Gfo/Idh/MocA family oxidoreductase [Deltaproteobacteria bacterium]